MVDWKELHIQSNLPLIVLAVSFICIVIIGFLEFKKVSIRMEELSEQIKSLRMHHQDMIINDRTFFQDGKFSRSEYEKFLLKNGLSAPEFEQNLSEQEKKRQLLSFLSEGVHIPDFLVQTAFNKENQIKQIQNCMYIIWESNKITKTHVNRMRK